MNFVFVFIHRLSKLLAYIYLPLLIVQFHKNIKKKYAHHVLKQLKTKARILGYEIDYQNLKFNYML